MKRLAALLLLLLFPLHLVSQQQSGAQSKLLVLLDANPLENISNTQRINAVIVNRRYLSKEYLQKMLADAETSAAKK